MRSYANLGAEIGKLVQQKQQAYGDSFGKAGDVLRIMYPDGIKPEQYDDVLTITRILDKLFRIANEPDAFGESPYRDIAGYGLLGAARSETSPTCQQVTTERNIPSVVPDGTIRDEPDE